jgi:hypothetical protein
LTGRGASGKVAAGKDSGERARITAIAATYLPAQMGPEATGLIVEPGRADGRHLGVKIRKQTAIGQRVKEAR